MLGASHSFHTCQTWNASESVKTVNLWSDSVTLNHNKVWNSLKGVAITDCLQNAAHTWGLSTSTDCTSNGILDKCENNRFIRECANCHLMVATPHVSLLQYKRAFNLFKANHHLDIISSQVLEHYLSQ